MAGPGTKLSRHGAHLASCATKFAQRGSSTVVSAKKFSRRGAFTGSPATKFAQRSPYYGVFAKKLARQAIKRHFWGIFRALGELFRAHTHHQTKQGELCTARGAGVGTKLSPHAARQPHPVQNSPGSQPRRAQPVQNSPGTPEIPIFDAFCASRESFIPLPPPPSRAGRIKSRTNTPPHPPTRPSPNFACNSPK